MGGERKSLLFSTESVVDQLKGPKCDDKLLGKEHTVERVDTFLSMFNMDIFNLIISPNRKKKVLKLGVLLKGYKQKEVFKKLYTTPETVGDKSLRLSHLRKL